MALTPVQIIETVCPELASSPSRDAFIQMAVETTDKGVFGQVYPYAIAYLACHSFTLFSEEGGSGYAGTGKIASKSEGDVSVSYFDDSTNSAASASSTEYGKTKYGEMYLALRARIPRMNVNCA
jgi:hypothetical protein